MKPAAFDYFAPTSTSEAIRLLSIHDQARPLAGGQSLVPMMNLRLARPAMLVDLNRITELVGIREKNGALHIGSMTRQAALLDSPLAQRLAPLVTEALVLVGHPPTRARGTIGGSLSNADPAAELPAVMLALDARLVLRGATGERIVGASAFFRGMFETAIEVGELVTEICIPAQPKNSATAFLEVARRRGDFAVASVAANLTMGKEDRCEAACVVLGAVQATPIRCPRIEAMLAGQILTGDLIAAAAGSVDTSMIELDSHGASKNYRLKVARVLVKRALETVRTRGQAVA